MEMSGRCFTTFEEIRTKMTNHSSIDTASGKELAFGGVLFDEQRRILLRSPRGDFGGDRWTFPKGRPNPGETPEATALREVLEETGYKATIICEVPGTYEGDVTSNRYFIMHVLGEQGSFDSETEEVRWVTYDEAVALIDQKVNRKRERDLAVIRAASEAYP
jgi:8-oxo-dGTP diphosphatase